MKILFTAATEMEIQPFKAKFPEVETLVTGVGGYATIFHLMEKLNQINYDFVFQIGIAGVYLDDNKIGAAVKIGADRFADLGVYQKKELSTFFGSDLCPANQFPFQGGWLLNDRYHQDEQSVLAASVNMLTDDEQLITALHDAFHPMVESMEGAAFHYVCLMKRIPFLQIRGISNRVGVRDKSKWKTKEAIQAASELLMQEYQILLNK